MDDDSGSELEVHDVRNTCALRPALWYGQLNLALPFSNEVGDVE